MATRIKFNPDIVKQVCPTFEDFKVLCFNQYGNYYEGADDKELADEYFLLTGKKVKIKKKSINDKN